MAALTDTAMTELAAMGPNHVAKELLSVSLIGHGAEMYGTMAVYLRLKGLERDRAAHDRAAKSDEKEQP